MKLKKINQKKYNLINKILLNTRSYLGLKKLSLYYLNSKYIQGFKNKFCIFEIIKTKIYFKNNIKIIYKYHCSNEKILFIGFPEIKNDKFTNLFEKTKHYYIPSNVWVNNIIINKSQILYHLQNKTFNNTKKNIDILKNTNKILKIQKKPDLIVLYNQNFELNATKESLNSHIPVITFLNSSYFSNQINYKIPVGSKNQKFDKFCYLLLKSLLSFSSKSPAKLKKQFYNKKFQKSKKNLTKIDFWH